MKKDSTKSLLKTKISEMTPDKLANLEKPIGTSTRPFPMWGTQRTQSEDRSELRQVLSVIADDSFPLMIYSEREYKEVVALAYCDMPVPSMLPDFFKGIERRKPESTNRTQMMIGDPGHGKSFLGALQGRIRAKGPVEIFDCGGKNMNDLLFEMVLDFGAGDALPDAIDKRLAAGTLKPMSIALLKDLPCVSLDAEGGIAAIDWNALKTSGSDNVQRAYEQLTKVSKIEGLDNAGGNALGMNSAYGPLVRAFMEGREIVLDEYNKSREGSDNALQTVIQFLIGEISECTVENPLKNKDNTSGPSTFTFKRSDTALGFFVTFTGNRTEDGITTRSLNKSVYSRLSPDTLPNPVKADWQHRICQMMVGIPVSTLYEAFKERADANPAAFGDWLMWLRKTKAEVDGAPIPEVQETLLKNWKDVVQASEKMARIYEGWAERTDAEKITENYPGLVMEVDEEYSKKEGIDFRKIKQHLEEALQIRPAMLPSNMPRMLDMKAWETAPRLGDKVEENPALRFGTRLAEVLERIAYEKSGAIGKDGLYRELKSLMEQAGLRDISLQEGARSQQRSIEQLLNVSAFDNPDLGKQAEMARKVFCDYLRQMDVRIQASDDDIVTKKKFHDILQYVAEKNTAAQSELFIPNRDIQSLMTSPVIGAKVVDAGLLDVKSYELEEARKKVEKAKESLDQIQKELKLARKELKDEAARNPADTRNITQLKKNVQKAEADEISRQDTFKKASQKYDTAEKAVQEEDASFSAYSLSDLVHHDDIMTSFALPTIGAKNLGAIWESNLRPLFRDNDHTGSSYNSPEDEEIAEGASKSGLGTTTLKVRYQNNRGEDDETSLHIVRNTIRGKTLIVGEKVPSKLQAAFREAGIIHVDRADPNAKAKVEMALAQLTQGLPQVTKDRLRDAFIYRNNAGMEAHQNVPLADLMVERLGERNRMPGKYVFKKAMNG
jgi:hypothetical protein